MIRALKLPRPPSLEPALSRAPSDGFSRTCPTFSRHGFYRLSAGSRLAFESIRELVSARAGVDAFDGVTVQRMVRSSNGYELILGSSIHPQFGPVLLFGAGGQLVDLFNDHALALPPLTTTLVRA